MAFEAYDSLASKAYDSLADDPDSPVRVEPGARPWDRRKPRTLRIATDDATLAQASASQRQRPDSAGVLRRFNERRASEAQRLRPAASQAREPQAVRKVLRLRKAKLPNRQSYSIEERDPAAEQDLRHEDQRIDEMRWELMQQFRQGVDCGHIREVGPWSPASSTARRGAAREVAALLDAGMTLQTPQSTRVYRMKRELMKQFQLGLESGAIKQVGSESPGLYPCTPTVSAEGSTLSQRRGSGRRDVMPEFQLANQKNVNLYRRTSSAGRARNHLLGQIERCSSGLMQVSPHPAACSRRRMSEDKAMARRRWSRCGHLAQTMTAIMVGAAIVSTIAHVLACFV